jgi:branched-chain amino acid transport system substrate-binding protein
VRARFKANGINIVSLWVAAEVKSYLANAIAAQPDVLLILNFGSQSSDTLRQAISFGMKKNTTLLVAWASGLEQFEGLGAELLEDVYFGTQYWHDVSSPANQTFVESVRSRFSMSPNYSMASAYATTALLLDAVARTESADCNSVIKGLEGMRYPGLTGDEEIRSADHQVLKNYYLMRGKAKAAMRNPDDFAEILNAGASFLSAAQAGCRSI